MKRPQTALRYGVDGFPHVFGMSAAALGSATACVRLARRGSLRMRALAVVAGVSALTAGVPAALGWRYVLAGKLAVRDLVLDEVDWRGDETVLDLGAGRGLLGIGAAERTTGHVICADIFVGKDLLGNGTEPLLANARAAGVGDRIEVRHDDARALSLGDDSVDVVVSTLCLHNIADPAGRVRAIDEVVRVLRPGGTVVISDLAHVDDEYIPRLRAAGLVVDPSRPVPGSFPPQRLLKARAVAAEGPGEA